ncbi:MAG: AAA family ATPase [Deltaproteobacteria bacterium]|nr:AAA family ATPase [Deltaproteobacteria bacterium]MCX7953279.1 AAA family ATPase [Deltaproteobacteria bacterium]
MKAKIISFASGKGGVGKTSISLNTSLAFVDLGRKTLQVDLDFGLANVEVMLNIKPIVNMKDLPKLDYDFSRLILTGTWGLDIISCGRGFSWLNNLSHDQRKALLLSWRNFTEAYDVVVIDSCPSLNVDALFFLSMSDLVVIITTPEITAVLDAYVMLKTLATRFHVKNFGLVVNKVKSPAEGSQIYEAFAGLAMSHLNVRLGYFGHVLLDDKVGESVRMRSPFFTQFPSSKASKCIRAIANLLLEELILEGCDEIVKYD